MAEAVFHPPRRKRRVFETYDAPFPVDVGGKDFRMCRAEIINNNVIVRNPEDIEQLYNKQIQLNIEESVIALVQKLHQDLSEERYQRRVQWAKSILQEQGFDDGSVTRILENYTKPLELPLLKEDGTEPTGNSCNRMGPNTDLSRQSSTDTGNIGALSAENENAGCKQARLEGDPACAPVTICGSKERQQGDSKERAEASCQERGFLVCCGCEAKESVEQQSCETIESKECAPEYVLVEEEDEGSLHPEGDSAHEQENLVKKEKLVCRRNPFSISEYLQLSLEEEPLTILKLWEVFSEVKPNFKTTYMAYHYFRSKGWVPKVGLKYGTDLFFSLRIVPSASFSSYSVLAELVDDSFEGSLRRPLSWKSLSGLNRTTANASKELMLCYLIRPSDMTEKEMSTPECMKRIKVQELIVSRWVSSRERSEQDEF
ncbi:Tsen2 [Columba livia]|nr:Tsen2 [Columba livia]